MTARLEEASLCQARQLGREIRYLNSAQHSKEDVARQIATRDRIKEGLICVLRSVDPCMSFQINKNHQTRKLEIHYRKRKCLHLYHYQIHPVFGFMHARIQTWFPFRVYVCLNGREWLARQMDQAKLHYVRRDNTFTWLEDLTQAQALFDQQAQANWPQLLDACALAANPACRRSLAGFPATTTGRSADSEWASDVLFPVPGSPGHGLPASVALCHHHVHAGRCDAFPGPTGAGQRQSPPCLPPRDQQQHQGTPRKGYGSSTGYLTATR